MIFICIDDPAVKVERVLGFHRVRMRQIRGWLRTISLSPKVCKWPANADRHKQSLGTAIFFKLLYRHLKAGCVYYHLALNKKGIGCLPALRFNQAKAWGFEKVSSK
jgi:hypothetical protein